MLAHSQTVASWPNLRTALAREVRTKGINMVHTAIERILPTVPSCEVSFDQPRTKRAWDSGTQHPHRGECA